MAKCFREVKKKLPESKGKDCEVILKDVGMVVLNSVGGAMGALYGTFFLKLAQASSGKKGLQLNDFVAMFQLAEQGILEIGKAKVGDKTLIDTLSPAVRSLEDSREKGLSFLEALTAFEEAAKKGMESTKDLVAKTGRASRLGERTIGNQDPGATSCYLILSAMVSGLKDT
jgi:dihydroxyacetone kinase-like protein